MIIPMLCYDSNALKWLHYTTIIIMIIFNLLVLYVMSITLLNCPLIIDHLMCVAVHITKILNPNFNTRLIIINDGDPTLTSEVVFSMMIDTIITYVGVPSLLSGLNAL